jgi:hypothetical protein
MLEVQAAFATLAEVGLFAFADDAGTVLVLPSSHSTGPTPE